MQILFGENTNNLIYKSRRREPCTYVAECGYKGENSVSNVFIKSCQLENHNETECYEVNHQQDCANVAEILAKIGNCSITRLTCVNKTYDSCDATECQKNNYHVYKCL